MANKRVDSDEIYVVDLISEIMDENYKGQMKFDSLLGDPGKSGQKRKLPVDAYFPKANLIVEYLEKQHFESVNVMDRRMTISGVCRGEQRKLYDLRKEKWATDNQIRFMVVTYIELAHKSNGRLKKDKNFDLAVLKAKFQPD